MSNTYKYKIKRLLRYRGILPQSEITFLKYFQPNKHNFETLNLIERKINKLLLLNRASKQNAKITKI